MTKMGFLTPIETLRKVYNWSIHQITEDKIHFYKNPILISNEAPNLQDPSFQWRSTSPINFKRSLELWYHLLNLAEDQTTQ